MNMPPTRRCPLPLQPQMKLCALPRELYGPSARVLHRKSPLVKNQNHPLMCAKASWWRFFCCSRSEDTCGSSEGEYLSWDCTPKSERSVALFYVDALHKKWKSWKQLVTPPSYPRICWSVGRSKHFDVPVNKKTSSGLLMHIGTQTFCMN